MGFQTVKKQKLLASNEPEDMMHGVALDEEIKNLSIGKKQVDIAQAATRLEDGPGTCIALTSHCESLLLRRYVALRGTADGTHDELSEVPACTATGSREGTQSEGGHAAEGGHTE